jgi:activator of HSP90 ATPase
MPQRIKTEDIEQELLLPVAPGELYELWLDSESHSAFTGADADLSFQPGSEFSAYDGYITGINTLLEPGSRIVQAWQAFEDGWPEQHFSELTLSFQPHPEGCRLHLLQRGVPAALAGSIAEGWHRHYWEPLRNWLSDKQQA